MKFLSILIFMHCSIFSETKKYPNISLNEYKENSIYRLEKKYLYDFQILLNENHLEMKEISFSEKNFVYINLNETEISILEKSNIKIKKIDSAAFKYYDSSYEKRLSTGYENLESIQSGYKDELLNEIYLRGIASEFSDRVELHSLGKSRLGRKIYALKILPSSKNILNASVLFLGAIHSNELISTEHVYDVIYQILKYPKKYSSRLKNLSIWCVPIMNPDGMNFFWNKSIMMGRKNGFLSDKMLSSHLYRGVDLNRNFPFKWNSGQKKASSGNIESVFYRGDSFASEPETKAMIQLAKKERFIFSFSFHSHATAILFPYTIEETKNPSDEYPKFLGEKILEKSKSYRTDREYSLKKNLYPVDGTDQDFYYNEFGTNSFIIESSHHNPIYSVTKTVLGGFRNSWILLLDEFYDGEKIILQILDETKKPISAKIEFDGIDFYEGEKFTSKKSDGIFMKFFKEKTKLNFKIEAKNFKSEQIELESSSDIKLNPIILKK